MPAAIYIAVAVVGVVAVGFAFKEFVYDPHVAPRLEEWIEELSAQREARRRQRQISMPIPQRLSDSDSDDDEQPLMRPRTGFGAPPRDIPLEPLVSPEVREWRSHPPLNQTLRRRFQANETSTNNSPNTFTQIILPSGFEASHVLFNPPLPSIPTTATPTAASSRTVSPPAFGFRTPLRQTSQPTLHSPSSQPALLAPQFIAPEDGPVPTTSPSPNMFLPSGVSPSLSQIHPVELEYERDVEFLSPPSSRSSSPFSAFSSPGSDEAQISSPVRRALEIGNDFASSFASLNSPEPVPVAIVRSPSDSDLSDLDGNLSDAFSNTTGHTSSSFLDAIVDSDGESDSSWASANVDRGLSH